MSWLCVFVAYRRFAVERVALHVGVVIWSCDGRSFNAALNPLVRRSIAALSWSEHGTESFAFSKDRSSWSRSRHYGIHDGIRDGIHTAGRLI